VSLVTSELGAPPNWEEKGLKESREENQERNQSSNRREGGLTDGEGLGLVSVDY